MPEEELQEQKEREEDRRIWRQTMERQEMYNTKCLIKLDRMIDLLQLIYESNTD